MINGKRLFAGIGCAALLSFPFCGSRAQHISDVPDDVTSIARWLSEQTANGIAFHTVSKSDQPTELTKGEMELDLNAGLGFLPLNHKQFPEMQVDLLKERDVASLFSSEFNFPDATIHFRTGLYGRTSLGFKISDTTIPKRKVTESTSGKGQSNVLGLELKRYFLGRGRPLISLSATADYVRGYFDFLNEFHNVTMGIATLNSNNTGELKWNIQSYGLETTVSGYLGPWMPFLGLGYNYNAGDVKTRIFADFKGDTPDLDGRWSAPPTRHTMRISTGTRYGLRFMNLTLNGQMLAVGKGAGRTFAMNFGVSVPFNLKPGSREYNQFQVRNKPEGKMVSNSFSALQILQ